MPYSIELVGSSIHQRRDVGQNARFEIAGHRAFHAESSPSQIGRTYVSDLAIEDQYFEMYARTQPPLQSAPQQRIFVEIVGEVPSRLFGMNQPHLDTAADQFLQHFQQRCGTVALFHIKIFNIGRADPEVLFLEFNL